MPQFLVRNLRLKILALLVATVTWTGVVYAGNPPASRTITVRVPQDPGSLPAKFVLVHPISDLAVTVSGTRDNVNAFDPATLRLSADYRSVVHVGVQQIPVVVSTTNKAVELDNPPTSVEADIDQLTSTQASVTVVINPPPPVGYITNQQIVSPQVVTLSGPAHELQNVRAQVQLNLSNQKTNLEQDVPVFVYNSSGLRSSDIAATPATVRVTITVVTTVTSRSSAVVPATSGAVANGYQLLGMTVSPPTVVLTGPRDLLNALDSISTSDLSLTGLTGDVTRTLTVTPPSGVSASPSTVVVVLHIVAIAPTTPPPSPTPTP